MIHHDRHREPVVRRLLLFAWLMCTAGCQTWQKSHEAAALSFASGDLTESQAALETAREKFRSEQQLLDLDQSLVDLASGKSEQSETRLRHLRDELAHLEQKDVTEQTASLMTDSRAIAWSGRDFERRMILNMALLSSLVGDRQDSFAWSMQVAQESHERRVILANAALKETSDNAVATQSEPANSTVMPVGFEAAMTPKTSAVRSANSDLDQTLALGSYLSAVIQSEQPTRSSETQQLLNDVAYWNPRSVQSAVEGATQSMGVRCQPGHGAIHIIALVGQAPRWVSESAAPTSAALLIADRIVSATGKHTLPPTIAAVKIAQPMPSGRSLPPSAIRAAIQSHPSVTVPIDSLAFSTIIDLEAVAQASYLEHRDQEIAKAISRRVLKKGAVYVLKETQKVHRNSLVDFGINAAGVAWEALEKADTRSWRLLPARVDVAQCELPAGDWTLELGTSTTRPTIVSVPVADGRNTTVVVFIPDAMPTGNILIGGPEHRSVPVTQALPAERR